MESPLLWGSCSGATGRGQRSLSFLKIVTVGKVIPVAPRASGPPRCGGLEMSSFKAIFTEGGVISLTWLNSWISVNADFLHYLLNKCYSQYPITAGGEEMQQA